MKRFWLVMLSLGLVLAFSAQAFAVDVKFSGDFSVGGMYLDKTTLNKAPTSYLVVVPSTTGPGVVGVGTQMPGPSTAFYYQRLRLRTDFVVSPGLSFVTRADIMSRVWGGKRASADLTTMGGAPLSGSAVYASPGSTYESENIVFDWAYINYVSPIGLFMIGYQNDNAWGTVFGDSAVAYPGIEYILPLGQFVLIAKYSKGDDGSRTAINSASTNADFDQDQYVLAGIYKFKQGEVGMLVKYLRAAEATSYMLINRNNNDMITAWIFAPYTKFKVGPVAIQAEVNYLSGTIKKEGVGSVVQGELAGQDVAVQALAAFVDATADFNMFYVGGTFAYVSGDDPGTPDKSEGAFLNGGTDWNPCLIMWNNDRTYWAGSMPGASFAPAFFPAAQDGPMGGSANGIGQPGAWFFQGRAGVRPIPALDIMASVSYANADKKPADGPFQFLHNDFGWEADLTATYKITNNLSYMLGGAYLWTGGYYKGSSDSNQVSDNYMIINKLTLTF